MGPEDSDPVPYNQVIFINLGPGRFHILVSDHESTSPLVILAEDMSSAKRRRGKSLHLELSNGPLEEKPPIAALFLVKFDAKAG